MPAGGARKGAGRKSIAEETRTKDLAQKAIIAKYGTLEEGLESLLATKEPVLVKFVFEHAFGKPTDPIEGDIGVSMKISFTNAGGAGN